MMPNVTNASMKTESTLFNKGALMRKMASESHSLEVMDLETRIQDSHSGTVINISYNSTQRNLLGIDLEFSPGIIALG